MKGHSSPRKLIPFMKGTHEHQCYLHVSAWAYTYLCHAKKRLSRHHAKLTEGDLWGRRDQDSLGRGHMAKGDCTKEQLAHGQAHFLFFLITQLQGISKLPLQLSAIMWLKSGHWKAGQECITTFQQATLFALSFLCNPEVTFQDGGPIDGRS